MDAVVFPDIEQLQSEARELRRMVIDMAYRAGSGHCGGSLSCAEILLTLYRCVLKVRPAEPNWPDRDRFILSKGHAAPMLYAVLARLGFFPVEWLGTLRQLGSPLQGHPDMCKTPGIDMSTGSLGMGLSAGIGMAWSARLQGKSWRVFVLVGDGELNEGQNWEAAMLASKLALSNLVLIVDLNQVQLDGPTSVVMPLGSVSDKFRAFGWSVRECNGHSLADLIRVIPVLPGGNQPAVLIARTVKGKGVSFMEGDHRWHGAPLTLEDYRTAIADLEEIIRER
ncbi:MAG: transketolase [Acidobacteria bacterium]|nr:transketolase [Acidobacteriota bacterium]